MKSFETKYKVVAALAKDYFYILLLQFEIMIE